MPVIYAESAQIAGDLIGKSFMKKMRKRLKKSFKTITSNPALATMALGPAGGMAVAASSQISGEEITMPVIYADNEQISGDLIGKSLFKKMGKGISKAGKGVVKAATSKTGIGVLSFAAGAGTGVVATKYGPGMLASAKKKLSALTSSGKDDDSDEVKELKAQIAAMQAQQAQQTKTSSVQQAVQEDVQPAAVTPVIKVSSAPAATKKAAAPVQTDDASDDDSDEGSDDQTPDISDKLIPASMSTISTDKNLKASKGGISPMLLLAGLGLGAFVMMRK
jgi:hypothetical protein